MNDLSLSSSPQFFSVISWKVFLCRKNPPQLPFSAHKKQVEKKEWPQWGRWGGGGGGVDGGR